MKKIVTKESIDTEVSSFKIIDYKCENGCTYFYVACPTCAKKFNRLIAIEPSKEGDKHNSSVIWK